MKYNNEVPETRESSELDKVIAALSEELTTLERAIDKLDPIMRTMSDDAPTEVPVKVTRCTSKVTQALQDFVHHVERLAARLRNTVV